MLFTSFLHCKEPSWNPFSRFFSESSSTCRKRHARAYPDFWDHGPSFCASKSVKGLGASHLSTLDMCNITCTLAWYLLHYCCIICIYLRFNNCQHISYVNGLANSKYLYMALHSYTMLHRCIAFSDLACPCTTVLVTVGNHPLLCHCACVIFCVSWTNTPEFKMSAKRSLLRQYLVNHVWITDMKIRTMTARASIQRRWSGQLCKVADFVDSLRVQESCGGMDGSDRIDRMF